MKKQNPSRQEKKIKVEKITRKQVAKDVAVFIANMVVIVGLFVLSIFLNGIGINPTPQNFFDYFKSSTDLFIYLSLTMLLILFAYSIFLFYDNKEMLKKASNFEMLLLIIEISLVCNYAAGKYVSIYFRPLALAGLLTLLLADRRTAVFTNITVCVLTFLMDVFTNASFDLMSPYANYSSLIIGFTSGIFGIYLIDGVQARLKVFGRGIVMIFPVVLCLVLLEQTDLLTHPERLVAGISSAILSIVLFMSILPVLEALFNKITSYKLAELADHSAPLIRKMIEKAPGTFNHSIVVANIAEACAVSINEDPLLARCCAYYHDMGKLKQPEMFKENQQDGKNVHDELTPELSTNIIRAHTKDGYELLKKNHLPDMLADVCLQHHGTMPILYFYAKAKKFTDGEIDIDQFSYTGPLPKTKIAAIIMIADSAEAAVRSCKERSRATVDKVVEKIINERMILRQFDDCDITMKELNVIRNTIVNNLTGVYHSRIEYPKVNIERLKTEEMV